MSGSVGREVLQALQFMAPLRREIARLLPEDVPPAGLTALRVIGRSYDGRARVSDVAAAQHVGLPVASRQVRHLEDQGLVTREVSAEDRRAHHLTLTPEGRALLDHVDAELVRSMDLVLADWPADDAHQLARLMSRLHADISRLPGLTQTDAGTDTGTEAATTEKILQESHA